MLDIEENIGGQSYIYSISDGRNVSIVEKSGTVLKINLPHNILHKRKTTQRIEAKWFFYYGGGPETRTLKCFTTADFKSAALPIRLALRIG